MEPERAARLAVVSLPALADIAPENLPRALAEALVGITATGAGPLDGFLILFRSASSPVAARIARERIAAVHRATAMTLIEGDHAAGRAALLLSLVAGVQMMRQMIELAPLAGAEPIALTELLTPIIAAILFRSDS